jgi:hypothetical protein
MGMYVALMGFLIGVVLLVRRSWGAVLDNSPAFQMFCIGIFSSCMFSYIPDIINKEKDILTRFISFALAMLFLIWLMASMQNYQIKFLMGL